MESKKNKIDSINRFNVMTNYFTIKFMENDYKLSSNVAIRIFDL
ncbi:hypothetical protein LACWKB10_0084 [Lactobacillus sp. wkB10]|nr:hypothetical protein LACWKB10_0084 [Lactobacillus sp. wkB10]